MRATLKSKVSKVFTKYNFSHEDAGFLSEVLNEIDNRQDEKFQVSKELFLTKKDKAELIEKIAAVKKELNKSIFTAGIIQLLAIIGSVLAIISFLHK